MHKKFRPMIILVLLVVLAQLACEISVPDLVTATSTPVPPATATKRAVTPQPTGVIIPPSGSQPVLITGTFSYTNDFVLETYFVEHAVALVDMHGFILRDKEWEIPVTGQTLGFMTVDPAKKGGAYRLELPAQPFATYNDLSRGATKGPGVQVFAVAYWGNLAGGPYAEGDDRSLGWPTYLASMVTDSGNKDEVTGGKLVVWAPDDKQVFPTAFGADGLLFTADDPLAALPAGYSLIDLDQKPFGISRKAEETVTLLEPKDLAVKDFSNLSYTDAFQKMFDTLKNTYAFNGVAGKAPEWDKVYAAVMPQVKDAEAKRDATAYYKALRQYELYFNDGHTSLDGGDVGGSVLSQLISYGYGFAIRELDDGRSIVVYVTSGGAAQSAGIKVGAEVTSFNGTPIADAIGSAPLFSTQSTDIGRRAEKARMLLRGARNSEAKITYKNPGQAEQTASLRATAERQSFFITSPFNNLAENVLPVEYSIRPSNVGYVKINSNYDDLNLIIRLFDRALKTFESAGVSGIIIDLRANTGGSPLGLAGFLTDKDILMGQLEYYSDTTGKFEPDGPREKFTPNVEQYRFNKMVLMVDQACYSACELEAYGFSQVPGMVVVGMFPSAGVEAEVARGQFKLPEGMSFQTPTGRFTLPDGSIFLEGKGVQPTVRVPITAENVLSTDDVVLNAAEAQIKK